MRYAAAARRRRTPFVILLALLGLASVAACQGFGPIYRSEVVVEHALPAAIQGETFTIRRSDESKPADAEFESYARLIAERLGEHGFHHAGDRIDGVDYLVLVDFEVFAVQTYKVAIPLAFQPIEGFIDEGGLIPDVVNEIALPRLAFASGRGGVGSVPHLRTEYTRVLTIEIVDRREPEAEDGKGVYKAIVVSTGWTKELPRVIPHMIHALFEVFPGESRLTRIVDVRAR